MKRVVIESPLSPSNGRTFAQNMHYAKLCGLDCIRRGEAPYASHLLMPQFLNDAIPEERTLGMEAGFVWGAVAELIAVYTDFGISSGMTLGVEQAIKRGQPVEYRKLPALLLALADSDVPTRTEGA